MPALIHFVKRLACGSLLVGMAWAQQDPSSLSFEVAAIKPVSSLGRVQGKIHIGMRVDRDQVDIGYISIAELIQKAYGLRSYEVAAPQWARTERFDIAAKIPDGVHTDKIPLMLRELLFDRFQLKFHHELAEQSVYALTVSKNGLKLIPAAASQVAPDVSDPSTSNLSLDGHVSSWQSGNRKGTKITTAEGGAITMSTVDSKQRIEGQDITLRQLAYTLSELLHEAVVDRTDIVGSFQIELEISRSDALGRIAERRGGEPAQRTTGSPVPLDSSASDPDGGATVFAAVQRLGLKLERRKEMIDKLVVDHVEKAPTAN